MRKYLGYIFCFLSFTSFVQAQHANVDGEAINPLSSSLTDDINLRMVALKSIAQVAAHTESDKNFCFAAGQLLAKIVAQDTLLSSGCGLYSAENMTAKIKENLERIKRARSKFINGGAVNLFCESNESSLAEAKIQLQQIVDALKQ